MIYFDEMAKAHERLFPKADLASQIYKLEEEIKEYDEALSNNDKEQEIKELADIGIVCIGIYRFTQQVAMWVYDECENMCFFRGCPQKRLEDEIKRKWAVNESRKWEWNGKTYHHVED